MGRPNRSHVVIALASSIVTLVVAGGVALASIPDAGEVIRGCRKISGGALRVINYPTQRCNPDTERRLDWNQTGPQGPPGPAGGLRGYEIVDSEVYLPASSGESTYGPDQNCPRGKVPINISWWATSDSGASLDAPVFMNRPVATVVADQIVGFWLIRTKSLTVGYTMRFFLACAAAESIDEP
jgi:hypothetical protein